MFGLKNRLTLLTTLSILSLKKQMLSHLNSTHWLTLSSRNNSLLVVTDLQIHSLAFSTQLSTQQAQRVSHKVKVLLTIKCQMSLKTKNSQSNRISELTSKTFLMDNDYKNVFKLLQSWFINIILTFKTYEHLN